jgi:steroid 5-alpha reductase family enzyme
MPMLLVTLGIVLTLMVMLWLLSLATADVSIVDIFWGPGFAVVGWASHAIGQSGSARAWLVCVLVTAWAARLAIHLAWRNLGRGEDYRYRAMRARYGARFPVVSLVTVFLLQGGLMWVVSLPLQAVHGPAGVSALGWIDGAGLALWTVGLTFEAVADVQLARFKRSAGSKGRVMDRGLWRYSRHPNYFGDCLVWWGFGLIALSTGAWWSLAGPIVMNVLLVRVSGVALLEATIGERRPGYREYVRRTSAFVPWPPRTGT